MAAERAVETRKYASVRIPTRPTLRMSPIPATPSVIDVNTSGITVRMTQHQDTDAHQHEREQGSDVGEVVGLAGIADQGPQAHEDAGDERRDVRDPSPLVHPGSPGWQQPVAPHRKKNPRLPVLEHEQHRRHRDDRTQRDDPADRREAGAVERLRERIGDTQLAVRDHPREYRTDDHVDHGADGESTQNADRQVALRVLGFLRRGGDGVETDVREKHDRGALMDPAKPVGSERVVVSGTEVREPGDDEQPQYEQLDRHHDVIGRGTLAYAEHEQPRDERDDHEGRQVHQDRYAQDVWSGLQQAVHAGIGRQERRTVPGNEPGRQVNVEAAEQRREVITPRDGDGHVADRVLENEVPTDDPRDQLSQG